jgi:F-type H+-transporting ATPase subunit delta
MAVYVSRYARALADVVQERKLDPASVEQQLHDFAATWAASDQLREFFLNPSVESVKRIALLDRMREKLGLATEVRNFFAVLISNERLDALNEILIDYHRVMNSRLGIADVDVTTARKLEDSERQELEQQIEKLAGGRIEAEFKEDSSILGGAIVRVGSMVYDGSLRGRLSKLKEQLIAG